VHFNGKDYVIIKCIYTRTSFYTAATATTITTTTVSYYWPDYT